MNDYELLLLVILVVVNVNDTIMVKEGNNYLLCASTSSNYEFSFNIMLLITNGTADGKMKYYNY